MARRKKKPARLAGLVGLVLGAVAAIVWTALAK